MSRCRGICEARYRLPVAVWRELMDRYFPNSGWLRLDRDTLDALQRFKAEPAPADLGAGDRGCSRRTRTAVTAPA